MTIPNRIRFVLLFMLVSQTSVAQNFKKDTIRLSLPQAEKAFLDSNLQLLAQKYNIDAQRALIIQAKLWPNPNLSISHGLYSGTLNKFFPTGANDETTAAISQLILLA